MKEISVIGSCVCRDLFEKDTENFSFHTDIRFISLISMISNPLQGFNATSDCFIEDVKTVNGKWYRKNVLNDLNKTVFSSLKERHGEYLVLDFAESRISLANIKWEDGRSLLVSKSVSFRAHYQASFRNNILKNTTLETINPLDYNFEKWEQTIDVFIERIKEIFDESKIILIKNMPARHFVDTNGHLSPYYSRDHFESIMCCDILLPRLNEFFIKKCPKCKIIEIPPFALGYQKHKWGNHPFHFTEVYYEYLLECVKAITLEQNYKKVETLYDSYSKKFEEEYNEAKLKTAMETKPADEYTIADHLMDYEEYNALGKKQKALILFALDKKHFFKDFKRTVLKKR